MRFPGAGIVLRESRRRRVTSFVSTTLAPGFVRRACVGLVLRWAGRLRRAPESTRLSYRLAIYGRNAERIP